ncbi:MAG: hypothetical protein RLZZ15_2474 [Verrucomicrobiota bacterium]
MNETADFVAALALGGGCLGGGLAYAIFGRARKFARAEQQGGTVVLGVGVMHAGYWLLQPAVRGCVCAGVAPATLTWASLAPAAAAGVAAAGGRWGFAAWGLFASALLDVLDGAVARATGRATPRGALLDSVLDRYAEFFFFAGVLGFYRGQTAIQLGVLAALFGSLLVTYSTAKAEALALTPPRGWMKRSDRLAVLIAGAGLAPLSQRWWEPASAVTGWPVVIAIGLIAVGANVSAAVRFAALGRNAPR